MKNRIDWRNHFIELVVVFIGITSAFTLNNWQENRKSARLEQKYISSVTVDIESDIEQFKNLIAYYDSTLNTVKRLDVLLRGKSTKDSINLYCQSLFVVTEFVPQSNTYESLKTSGQMEIISDFALKKQIHEVYLNYQLVKQVDGIYKDFSNQYILPFFIKNMNFRDFDIIGSGISNQFHFANIVNGYIVSVSQKVAAYRDALEKCSSLKETLGQFDKSILAE